MLTKRAFTLVELLVVIAIISVLAALLLPSLENSLYQSRLLSCGNTMRNMGICVTSYTADNRGWYPARKVPPTALCPHPALLVGFGVDDRALLRPYFPIDQVFLCPLSPRPESWQFDTHVLTSNLSGMYASYDLWFGNEIVRNQPATRMWRVGQRPVYNGHTFDILAADMDYDNNGAWGYRANYASHPSEDGDLHVVTYWDTQYAAAWWQTDLTPVHVPRGPITRNFLHDDGSVSTLWSLLDGPSDPRVVAVPAFSTYPTFPVKSYMPPKE